MKSTPAIAVGLFSTFLILLTLCRQCTATGDLIIVSDFGNDLALLPGIITQIQIRGEASGATITVQSATATTIRIFAVLHPQPALPAPYTAVSSSLGVVGYRIDRADGGEFQMLKLSTATLLLTQDQASSQDVYLLKVDGTGLGYATMDRAVYSAIDSRVNVDSITTGSYTIATAPRGGAVASGYGEWRTLTTSPANFSLPGGLSVAVAETGAVRTSARPRLMVSKRDKVPSTFSDPGGAHVSLNTYIVVNIEPSDASVGSLSAGEFALTMSLPYALTLAAMSPPSPTPSQLRWEILSTSSTTPAWLRLASTADASAGTVGGQWAPGEVAPTASQGGRSHVWVFGLFAQQTGVQTLGEWLPLTSGASAGDKTVIKFHSVGIASPDIAPSLSIATTPTENSRMRLTAIAKGLTTVPPMHTIVAMDAENSVQGYTLEVDPTRAFVAGTLTIHTQNTDVITSAIASGWRIVALRCADAYEGDCETVRAIDTTSTASQLRSFDITLTDSGRYFLAVASADAATLAQYSRQQPIVPSSTDTTSKTTLIFPFGLSVDVTVSSPTFIAVYRAERTVRTLPPGRGGVGVFLRLYATKGDLTTDGGVVDTGVAVMDAPTDAFTLTMTFRYDDSRWKDASVAETSLRFARYDDATKVWLFPTAQSVDITKNVLTATMQPYVEWAVLGIQTEDMLDASSDAAGAHVLFGVAINFVATMAVSFLLAGM